MSHQISPRKDKLNIMISKRYHNMPNRRHTFSELNLKTSVKNLRLILGASLIKDFSRNPNKKT